MLRKTLRIGGMLALSLAVAGGSRAGNDVVMSFEEPVAAGALEKVTTTVQANDLGLQVTRLGPAGDLKQATLEELHVYPETIRLTNTNNSFNITTLNEPDQHRTVIVSGDVSLVLKSAPGSSATTMAFDLSSDGGEVVIHPEGGGCVIARTRTYNVEYDNCDPACPSCSCVICNQSPDEPWEPPADPPDGGWGDDDDGTWNPWEGDDLQQNDDDDDEPGEPPWNSPIIDGAAIAGKAFHELNLHGEPNAAGLALVAGFEPEAGSLVGSGFELRDAEGNLYAVQVAGVGQTRFRAGTRDRVTTYRLTTTSPAHPEPQPLCASGPNEAILFSGDRYDATSMTVSATGAAASGWINIACANTAPFKLYLLRHTETSQQVMTTRADRQAMLKMLGADVYGDGTPFTVAGQPLLWQDAKGITTYQLEPGSIEALWSEHGAVCLNDPRRPDQAAAIDKHAARPPRCTEAMLNSPGLGYVISAHPRS